MVCAPWIRDFEKAIHDRQHIILYGNIDDRCLWQGGYQGVVDILQTYFGDIPYDIVANYDAIDGFTFSKPEMRQVFNELATQQLLQRHSPTPDTPPANNNPVNPPPRGNPGMGRGNPRVPLEEAFGNVRVVVSQGNTSVAVMVNLGDMLSADSDRYSPEERNTIVLLKKCTLEAAAMSSGDARGYRNTIILIASDLKKVPVWLYNDNPRIALVHITNPSREERRQFMLTFASGGFCEGDKLEGNSLSRIADDFAQLTDGFKTIELEAIRRTSLRESIPVTTPRSLQRLLDFYKFGQKDEPFEQINPEKIRCAREELSSCVVGQPRAINAVTTMLIGAKVGIELTNSSGRSTQPKGIFFFVGPTGVGKTELAKSLARMIFGEEEAFARFDMSEYKEEHSAEKLAGAPPGFVGYEAGGQLTNRVLQKPYSILLFDEIEKAHPKVLDKFLSILEDGRLTDGKGQTAYFNQTVIIFTSNIGASDLSDPHSGAIIRRGIMEEVQKEGASHFSYEQVERHFQTEVNYYFSTRIGRAELLNRLGDNIIVFDLLRPDYIPQIAEKFLRKLAESALEKHQLTLHFAPSVVSVITSRMQQGDNLLFGGRKIKTLIESLVKGPLGVWLFEHYPDLTELRGSSLTVSLSPEAVLSAD